MASGTAVRTYHTTITTAGTAETVTLQNSAGQPKYYGSVLLINRGSAEVYVRTDGTAPTVGGAESWVVPPNNTVLVPNLGLGHTSVSVVSATAGTAYSVLGN